MTQFKGQWWHPANKDNRVSGILSVGSDEAPLLELIGGIADSAGTQEWPDTPGWVTPALHGSAEGKYVTLLGAYSPQTKETMAADHSVEQDVSTMDGVLVGGNRHVGSVDEPIFRVLEVQLDYLTFWSGMNNFNYAHSKNAAGLAERSLTSTESGSLETEVGEWKISIVKMSGFSIGREYLGSQTSGFTELCVLRITSDVDKSAKSFLRPARIFQNLLTHAIRKPSMVRSMKLYEDAELGTGLSYDWYREEISPASDDIIDETTKRKALFTADRIDFSDIINKWFEIATQLGLTLDVLLGLDYSEHAYYENKLLNIATVIEATHREFFPTSVSREPDLHDRLRALLKQAIPKEHRGILSSFTNSPGYIQRCTELASIPDDTAVTELLGNVKTWAKWNRNARNDLAHLNPEGGRDIPEDVWFRLAPVSTALLHLVLMGKLGLSKELQQKAVRSGALESAAKIYLDAAREHL